MSSYCCLLSGYDQHSSSCSKQRCTGDFLKHSTVTQYLYLFDKNYWQMNQQMSNCNAALDLYAASSAGPARHRRGCSGPSGWSDNDSDSWAWFRLVWCIVSRSGAAYGCLPEILYCRQRLLKELKAFRPLQLPEILSSDSIRTCFLPTAKYDLHINIRSLFQVNIRHFIKMGNSCQAEEIRFKV